MHYGKQRGVTPMNDLAKAFDEYHKRNPNIWKFFEQFANELVMSNVKTLSAKRIFERMRWESDIRGDDGFKLNNNYHAFYARMYAKFHPEPDIPKFITRTSQADHRQPYNYKRNTI